jgi:purine-binding chemotaxis protein CheW
MAARLGLFTAEEYRHRVTARSGGRRQALIVAIGRRTCAIPLEHVVETMRPLPIEPVAGTARFIRGVSVIRGEPLPVVDLEMLLDEGASGARSGRFVTIKVGDRRVALAVEAVVGLRELDPAQLDQLPALLRDVDADLIEAIGTRDAQLVIVLHAARIVPDDVWAILEAGVRAP